MWQELYRMIYCYLYNMGLSHEDTEDVAQDTLLAVYLHLDGIGEGRLKTWLYTVARRKYIDWLRRHKKSIVLVNLEDIDLDAEVDAPEKNIMDKEKREEILKVMKALTKKEQELLALKYNLNLSYEEIGKILKMKTNTVKTGLYRARQHFKQEFLKRRSES